MNKKQLAKLAAIAGTAATVAPQVLPYIPAQYHPLAMGIVALLGILGGGAMQSPLAKAPLNPGEPKR